ncbi:3-oxoacyl-[acyl-carrier-protein] synthase III C-terminal domain-containing protein [Xanthomonas indica]|uniref:3-oxoacyl-[acyl-carrier-protein] synthase III C-terminal domain-containing protein n=1 Tax=Xanthomonas indica TaxID=2912242 RepID=A0AAU8I8P2_9XANT|nr:3-oxoacyl-[acyl-carrier-protein] synthase III C-terminal domain-containing protein [Xanthomonas indica]MCI2261548.1 ketoacyl-ACP synthase III [Xanthomonas indica]
MSVDTSRPIALRLLGTGEYLPAQQVPAETFDRRWGKPAGWTLRHTGVATRHYAGADEPATLMGERAARAALEAAQLQAHEVDCVISACSLMEQAIPCSAALLHARLGLQGSGIPAFDINATCLSFIAALDLAAGAIAAGRYRRVLIVSSEIASVGLNPDDADTAPLFGDGAAAVVLGADTGDSGSQLLTARLETYSEGIDHCRVRAGGTRLRLDHGVEALRAGSQFEMNGRATYRLAAAKLPGFLQRLLAQAGVELAQLRRIVPHQASAKALRHLRVALGLAPDALIEVIGHRGNQMAASIPGALHQAIASGRIVRGDLIGLVGSGAGLAFGGAVLRY